MAFDGKTDTNILYVEKNSRGDGSLEDPMGHFQNAVATIENNFSPSFENKYTVVCMDSSTYELSTRRTTNFITGSGTIDINCMAIPDYVDIYAPNAIIQGAVILGIDSKITCKKIIGASSSTFNNGCCIIKRSMGESYAEVKYLKSYGAAISNWYGDSKLFCDVGFIDVYVSDEQYGCAIGDGGLGTVFGDIIATVQKINLNEDNCRGIDCKNSAELNIITNTINQIGGVATVGIGLAEKSICNIYCNNLDCIVAYAVDGTSPNEAMLYGFINSISGYKFKSNDGVVGVRSAQIGASGNFLGLNSETITVVNGIITAITPP